MKLAAPSHPKFLLLLDRTGLRLHQVAGLLELTWLFVAEHAPQGDIGKWPNSMIERVIDWPGEPDKWVEALVAVVFLCRSDEHRLLVHDWPDHCPEMIRKRLKRIGENGLQPLSCRPHGSRTDAARLPDGGQTAAGQQPDSGRTAAHSGPGRVGPLRETRESACQTADVPALASTKKILKPERFEDEARDRVFAWAKKRGLNGRILDEGYRAWEEWGPAKNCTRPLSSWVGSFQRIVRESLKDGTIQRETDDERAAREIREFRERSQQPLLSAVGGADG